MVICRIKKTFYRDEVTQQICDCLRFISQSLLGGACENKFFYETYGLPTKVYSAWAKCGKTFWIFMLFKFVIDLAFKLFYTVQPMSLIYVNCEAYILIHIHLVLLTDYTRTMSIPLLVPKNIISPVVMKMLTRRIIFCEFIIHLLFKSCSIAFVVYFCEFVIYLMIKSFEQLLSLSKL